jgi:hypothetical protein
MQEISRTPAGVSPCRREPFLGRRALGAALLATLAVLFASSAAHAVTVAPLASTGAAGLPDDRGYEMISPPEKNYLDVAIGSGYNQISPSGETDLFFTGGGFGVAKGTTSTVGYLASRGAGGSWATTQALTPPQEPTFINFGKIYSVDSTLSKAVVVSTANLTPETPGYSRDYGNIYLADDTNGSYQYIASGNEHFNVSGFLALNEVVGSEGYGHVAIQASAALTPEAPGPFVENTYDFTDGKLHLAGILPDGSVPAGGSKIGGYGYGDQIGRRAISSDGTKTFFTAPADGSAPAQLYVRRNDTTTTLISRPNPGVVNPYGEQPATFGTASADGSTVYFTSTAKLTSDATAHPFLYVPGGDPEYTEPMADLYSYDVASGRLGDLTTSDPEGAAISHVIGASKDGSYVYFGAYNVLAPGAVKSMFQQENGTGNIYVEHDGAIRFIAIAPAGDTSEGGPGEENRVTPDGRHMEFETYRKVTSYENTEHSEYYVYDYDADTLSCASCNPDGEPPQHGAFIRTPQIGGGFGNRQYDPVAFSEDGSRFFFSTEEALVPGDTNGVADAYEWENGKLYLLSTGTSPTSSFFGDSTPSGNDATIVTTQPLVAGDEDVNYDVYDARVGGGAPSSLAPPACSGTGCQGVPQAPPVFSTPSSSTYNGVGNFAPAAKAKPKQVKSKKSKPKKAKKKARKSHGKKPARKAHKSATGKHRKANLRSSRRAGR